MTKSRSYFDGYLPSPDDEERKGRNFLDHYFMAVYTKLEADALLFNRKLPHSGLVGSENEAAVAELLRSFLPRRYGVELSGIVIDRHGNESRQCDIILFDAERFPTYFRKVFPVELVYGVIEVKTELTSSEAENGLQNLESVSSLDFRPRLTPYWESRAENDPTMHAQPPTCILFAFRSSPAKFNTFASWFPLSSVLRGQSLRSDSTYREIRTLTIVALDKGMVMMESSNRYVQRWIPVAEEDAGQRSFLVSVDGEHVKVDPAKCLLLALERIWKLVSRHSPHPGFDIRSYLSDPMNKVMDLGSTEPDIA